MIRVAIAVVIGHLVVSAVHGVAHLEDGVLPGPLDAAFIVGVITVAPILAAILLWRQAWRAGAFLLTFSMLGALLFGLAQHFLLPGPDNVTQQATGSWSLVFELTVLLLVPLEALGCWLGMRLIAAGQGAPSAHPDLNVSVKS